MSPDRAAVVKLIAVVRKNIKAKSQWLSLERSGAQRESEQLSGAGLFHMHDKTKLYGDDELQDLIR
jgi:hypothetical protein